MEVLLKLFTCDISLISLCVILAGI